MAENDAIQRLLFTSELAGVKAASAELRQYIRETANASQSQNELNASSTKLVGTFRTVESTFRAAFSGDYNTRLSSLRANVKSTAKEFDELRASIESVKTEAEGPGLNELTSEIKGGGGLSAGRQFLGAAGSIAGRVSPEAGAAIGTTSSLIEASKELPKFKEALSGLSGSLIATGGATVGLTLLVAALNQRFQEGKKAAEEELSARERALTLIQQGTTEQIQARIKELENERATRQALADDARKFNQDLIAQSVQTYGALRTGVAITNDQLGIGEGKFAAAAANMDAANKALDSTNTELLLLQQRAGDATPTLADQAAATKAATEATAELNRKLYGFAQDSIDNQVATNQKMRELLRDGTQQQLDAVIQSTQDQIAQLKEKINLEYAYAATLDASSDEYANTGKKIESLQQQQTNLQNSLNQLSGAMTRAYVSINDAARKQSEITLKSAASYEKYLNDVRKLDDDAIQQRIAAQSKYNQTLVTIAQEASKAAENALQALIQKRSELSTKLVQDEQDAETKNRIEALDEQIKYQRESVRMAREHQRDLEKIQKDAADREHDLLLSRDFAGLYALQRQTSRQIEESNSGYDDQQQNRLEAFQQENDDRARHFVEEQQQRQVNYQRQLSEAQAQYTRERDLAIRNRNEALQRAADANNQELLLISQKHDQALSMRRDAEVAELQLIRQSDEEKLKLTQQYATSAEAFLRNLANFASGLSGGSRGGGSGTRPTPYASGGNINAGTRALVNEPGSSRQESFSAGGRSIAFPGMGIFTPAQNGNINSGRGGIGSVTVNQYIQGRDEQLIAQIAEDRFVQLMEDFLQ